MPDDLDELMRQASAALGRMDYLTGETLCLQALAQARAARDWPYYARILLPLQECRRQRRMIAAEGVVRLGTTSLTETPPDAWIAQVQTGCICLTHPHAPADALALHRAARRDRLHLEVLFADNPAGDDTWTLRSFHGPDVACAFAAPPTAWRDRWIAAGDPTPPGHAARDAIVAPVPGATPSDWFLDAAEALGDAALQALGEEHRYDLPALEAALDVAPDHEILHQRLAAAARRQAVRP